MRHFALLSAAAFGLTPFGLSAQAPEKAAGNPVGGDAAPADLLAPVAQIAPQSVADKVAADWPRYDVGGKGHLTKEELGRWLSDLRAANLEPAPDAKWLEAAFAQTDTNKDQKVTREELTVSLAPGR